MNDLLSIVRERLSAMAGALSVTNGRSLAGPRVSVAVVSFFAPFILVITLAGLFKALDWGGSESYSFDITYPNAMDDTVANLTRIIADEMDQRGYIMPEGEAKENKRDGRRRLRWRDDLRRIRATMYASDEDLIEIRGRGPSALRVFTSLHEYHGSSTHRVILTIAAVIILSLFVAGIVTGLRDKATRRPVLVLFSSSLLIVIILFSLT